MLHLTQQGQPACKACNDAASLAWYYYYWSTMMAYVVEMLPRDFSNNKLLPCRCSQRSVKYDPEFPLLIDNVVTLYP